MPFVNVNGLKTHYEARGEGKTLVLVHGAGGVSTYWFNQLSGLSGELRIAAIDLPGHGKSEPLKGKPSIELYANHVYDFVRKMRFGRVVLLGHSMGGMVVQQIALKHPEILEKLVIVDSSAKFPGRSGLAESFLHEGSIDVNAMASWLFSKKTLKKTDGLTLLGQITQGMAPDFALSVLMRDFELAGSADLTSKLKAIGVPTLIVHGADDILPVSHAEYLHENIKGSRLEIIPDAGHMVMMEKPDEFNSVVMSFVRT